MKELKDNLVDTVRGAFDWLVESGEGIERCSRSFHNPRRERLVESGEGIERTEDARGRLRGGHWWNPVKELKATSEDYLSSVTPAEWNPVKELKAPNIRRVRPSDPHSGIR